MAALHYEKQNNFLLKTPNIQTQHKVPLAWKDREKKVSRQKKEMSGQRGSGGEQGLASVAYSRGNESDGNRIFSRGQEKGYGDSRMEENCIFFAGKVQETARCPGETV